jgi:hypothetical protein
MACVANGPTFHETSSLPAFRTLAKHFASFAAVSIG